MIRFESTRCSLVATIFAALAVAVPLTPVCAEERYWNNPNGGDFDDQGNWDDGTSGVPGFYDAAVFDIEGAFDVLFAGDQMNDRGVVSRGTVMFRMDTHVTYTLVNPLSPTPGLLVGGEDAAELILDQRAVIESRYAVVGDAPDMVGTLTATGPEVVLHVADELRVAHRGVGILHIDGGAAVVSGHGAIGVASGGLGAVDLFGPGTTWTCAGSLAVAADGDADLTVGGGATLECTTAAVASRPDSSGRVVVRGPGSSWTVAGALDVGLRGLGSMLIEDGGVVHTGDFATIGTFPWEFAGEGGIGSVTVRGDASSWVVGGDLHVGFLSHGTLVLSRGGSVAVDGDVLRGTGEGTTRLVIELGSGADYATPALSVEGMTDDFQPIVVLVDGFTPRAGDAFEIVRAQGGMGVFAFTLPELSHALEWEVVEETGAVSLRVASPCGPADLDGNGLVDFGDVLDVLQAWGPCEGCPEDLDHSGVVDFEDVLLVLAEWGPCGE